MISSSSSSSSRSSIELLLLAELPTPQWDPAAFSGAHPAPRAALYICVYVLHNTAHVM